jgi:hypothetical protein
MLRLVMDDAAMPCVEAACQALRSLWPFTFKCCYDIPDMSHYEPASFIYPLRTPFRLSLLHAVTVKDDDAEIIFHRMKYVMNAS